MSLILLPVKEGIQPKRGDWTMLLNLIILTEFLLPIFGIEIQMIIVLLYQSGWKDLSTMILPEQGNSPKVGIPSWTMKFVL